MSVSGILSSVMSSVLSSQSAQTQSTQNPRQQFQQEFQQLGSDLQSGNLSAAQTDFATLQQNAPAGSPLASAGTSSSLDDVGQQLDVEHVQSALAGSAVGKSFRRAIGFFHDPAGHAEPRRTHAPSSWRRWRSRWSERIKRSERIERDAGIPGNSGRRSNPGSLSNAQQAYTSLQQDFQQFATGGTTGQSGSSSTPSASISVNA